MKNAVFHMNFIQISEYRNVWVLTHVILDHKLGNNVCPFASFFGAIPCDETEKQDHSLR